MLAALTSFLNKSLAADIVNKENKCKEDCVVLVLLFHYYYLLLYSGLHWPKIVQQKGNGKLMCWFLRDHYYHESTEEPEVDHPSLKCRLCGRLWVGQLIAATETYVVDSYKELAMNE